MSPFYPHYRRLRTHAAFVLTLAMLLAGLLTPAAPALAQDAPVVAVAPAAPAADTPEDIVAEPFEKYTIGGGLLYWANHCYIPIGAPSEPPVDAAAVTDFYIRRQPTNGLFKSTLTAYQDDPNANIPHTCHTNWGFFADNEGLYYYSFDQNRIEFRPAGSPFDPATILLTNFPAGTAPNGENYSIRMATDADFVYWVGGDNAVYRAAKDGSTNAPVLVASGLVGPDDLMVVDTNVYVVDDGGLWRINKDQCAGGGACALTIPANRLSAFPGSNISGAGMTYHFFQGITVNTSADEIYWVSGTTIRRYRCPVGGAACSDELVRSAPGPSYHVSAPAFIFNTMFWHESDSLVVNVGGTLRRQHLDINDSPVDDIATNISTTVSRVFVAGAYVYFAQTNLPTTDKVQRLSINATAITRDLKADKWEVTQGIQNTLNQVPLVAKKTTFVRAWGINVAGPRAVGVTARLFGTRNGNPLPGSPLAPLNGTKTLEQGVGYSRASAFDAWLFQLPASWITAGKTTLRLVVDPQKSFADPDRNNNELITNDFFFVFESQPPACAVYVPVRTHTSIPNTDLPNFWDMVGRFQRRWPMPSMLNFTTSWKAEEIDVCWWGPVPYPCGGPFELNEGISVRDPIPDKDEVLIELWGYNVLHYVPACDDAGARTHFMGMVHPYADTGNIAGYASTVSSESWVKLPPTSPSPFPSTFGSMFEAGVMAQELTHNFGRKHIDCGNPGNIDTAYPYNPCRLSSVPPLPNADALHFGFDSKFRTPIAPNAAKDFMTYAGPTWVSDYTWKALRDAVAASSGAPQAAQTTDFSPLISQAGTVLASGVVNTTTVEGTLSYVKVLPEGALSAGLLNKWMAFAAGPEQPVDAAHGDAPAAPSAVRYHLRLLGPDNQQVADPTIDDFVAIDEHGEEAFAIFSASFPAPAGQVAKVQFMGDNKVIDEISFGPGKPVVKVTAPAAGATVSGPLTINWQASDPDDDAMLFTIWYSPDNFTSFYPVANNLSMTPDPNNPGQFTLNNTFVLEELSALPGSNTAKIRVLASDGFNTGVADSGPFVLTNRPPLVYITDPNAGQVYDPQFAVSLYGGATDAEDGLLEGDSLSWRIAATEVATGTDALLSGMAPGNYTVTLTATDSDAIAATEAAPLQIAPLSVPQASSPTMDGLCEDPGYSSGSQVSLQPYASGDQATVYLMRTDNHLWACFTGLAKGDADPVAFAGLRVDVNHDRTDPAQTDDYAFVVGEDGVVSTFAGDGAGNFASPGPDGLQAEIIADVNESGPGSTWRAELRIDLSILGGANRLVGLTAGHYSLNDAGNDFVWPYAAATTLPSTWATTALGSLPIIMGISPYTATVGSPSIQLTVEGSHFSPGAVLLWNGNAIAPTVAAASTDAISSTIFTVAIPANLLSTPGQATLVVRNPGPLDSSPVAFAVDNPAPVITSLSPDKKDVDSAGFTLTVNGSGFLNGAKVVWDGQELDTTFGSAAKVTAAVPAALLKIGGFAAVSVRNPAPAAADSNGVPFEIVPEGTPDMWLPSIQKQ